MFKRMQITIVVLLALVLGGCQSLAGPLATGALYLGVESEVELPSTLEPVEPGIALDDVDLAGTLPVDPDVRIGTLDNGLTYYVRRNTEPQNRAELRLVVNAGSVLEDEDQRGLAHFIEHMMFNGTRDFPELELVDFLESIGMEFGPDLNAYTSTDETVYMLHIPTDNAETVETAINVLLNWAAYATLSSEQIDAERGIVVEEDRLRSRTAGGRIMAQMWPVLLEGSRYAERLPIGDMEVIRNAPAETIRRFYESWYRPDLMAVVAVGDFDPDRIEMLIQDYFGELPASTVERPTYDVPDHEGTRYLAITDPEYPITFFEVDYLQESEPTETVANYRENLVDSLFQNMLNFRLAEISRQADSPFLDASVGQSAWVRPANFLSIGAWVQDENVLSGLDAVLTEIERVRRFGFTESELERAKRDILRGYQQTYNDRENIESSFFADDYVSHYLEGAPIPGITYTYALVQDLLPQISVEEINERADAFTGTDNRTVLVVGPEQEGVNLPSEEELAATIDSIDAKEITAYEDTEAAEELLSVVPEPVEIVAEETVEALGVTSITLANGVRVIMKPTDFQEEEVLFSAVSPGGSSLVPDEDVIEARLIPSIVNQSGVGELTFNELIRALVGRDVGVSPYIGEVNEGFNGSASPDDLDLLFQLIYLYATAPQADEAILNTLQDQFGAFLRNRSLDPDAALEDAITEVLYGDTIRQSVPPLEEIETFDLDRALDIYQERFADFSDFTFIFVGNFEVERLKALAQTYLGTLPTLDRNETWEDRIPDFPTGVIEEDVYQGEEERADVRLIFTGEIEPTRENQRLLGMLAQALNIRMTEELREERAGVYSAYAYAIVEDEPDQVYQFNIGFTADPARVEELVDATFGLIQEIQSDGPADIVMTKVKNQFISDQQENLEENNYWLAILEDAALHPYRDAQDVLEFQEWVRSVSADQIQQVAQQYLQADNYVEVVRYPAALQP